MKTNVKLILLLTCCYSCFGALPYKRQKPDGKLIGGTSKNPSRHPYLVSLQTRLFMIRAHVCGGTLLSENWVLSAAHCVKESFIVKWLPMDAIAGSSNAHDVYSFGPDAQVAAVDRRIPHPDYAGGIGPNDIAVLHTGTPFRFTKFVQPAKLPLPSKITYGSAMTLSGWGVLKTTFFFPDLPRYLQEVNVTYLPHKECNEAVEAIKDNGEANPLNEKSNICTGPITGGIAACSGDSGGPLIQFTKKRVNTVDDDKDNIIDDVYPLTLPQPKDEDSSLKPQPKLDKEKDELIPIVVGIVSWGSSPCGEKGAPTVYTKVETFVDFVNKYVNYLSSFYFIKLVQNNLRITIFTYNIYYQTAYLLRGDSLDLASKLITRNIFIYDLIQQ